MGEMEFVFVYQEARLAFVSGAFISTILLCQSFLERWLDSYLAKRGIDKIPRTLSGMIRLCKKESLLHEYLIQKIDSLRKIRNPFTHPVNDWDSSLGSRVAKEMTMPEEIMYQDAKEALQLLNGILTTHH